MEDLNIDGLTNFVRVKDKLIYLSCTYCNAEFSCHLKLVKYAMKTGRKRGKYCSNTCRYSDATNEIQTKCVECGDNIVKKVREIKKSKSGNAFCSRSCAATYNNKNKKYGYRRSKAEVWFESEIKSLYPNLNPTFNLILYGKELDIYFPSKKLAFEINGIFHYKPIYGVEKYNRQIKNDANKRKVCKNNNIRLVVINISKMKRFNIKDAQAHLKKIIFYIED